MKLKLLFAVPLVAIVMWQVVKLPPPYATRSAVNPPEVVPRPAGAGLHLPPGFKIDIFAEGFKQPRYMTLGPSSEILLSDSADAPDGAVYVLEGGNRKKLLAGLDRPFGLAFWKNYLYVAEATSLRRYPYNAGSRTAGKGEEVVPLAYTGAGHWTRTVLFSRDGAKLYLAVGSRSNNSTGEPPIRAAINRYNPDGSGHEIFASGMRNPIGLRWYPGSETLWATVQERDGLGDDLVPDYLTHVQQGGFYGWPYAYIGKNVDPKNKGARPDLVAKSLVPDVLLEPAHRASMDFIFYTGTQFPAEYRGGAFVAFHGSWNRSKRVGYSLGFIPFRDGKPTGPLTDFVTGWMVSPESREVWGRPVGLLQLPDGSLLLSDDVGNRIWKISYSRQ
jgi:glucose/arabinose dehydrogenase